MSYKYLIIAAAILFSYSGCSKVKKKYNVDFESVNKKGIPIGWKYTSAERGVNVYSIKLDSDIKNFGKYSLSIAKVKEGTDYGVASYGIHETFHGKEIQLRGYIKTEKVSGGFAGMWLRVDGIDGPIAFDNMQGRPITGSQNWKEYSITLPYNDEKATKVNMGVLLTGNGKIWLDNLRLYIDGKPIDQCETTTTLSKAEADTSFSKNSGIDTVILNSRIQKNIEVLCEVWGFLKYHNPEVAKGNYNFDSELFRILPAVVNSKNNTELSNTLEQWVEKFDAFDEFQPFQPPTQNNISQLPDFNEIFDEQQLSKRFIGKLKELSKIKNDTKNYYIKLTPGVGNPQFTNERTYSNMTYPDAGYRLLSLFRYWNYIEYFYPYKHLICRNWDDILSEYIPRFIKASNRVEYSVTTLSLINMIHDSHANVWNNQIIEDFKGKFALPYQAKFIENKLVITGFYNSTIDRNIKIGDIVKTIDGILVKDLVNKYLPLTAGSNREAQLRDMAHNFLFRSNNNSIALNIIRNGRIRVLKLTTIPAKIIDISIDNRPNPNEPEYRIEKNIGYLLPSKYRNDDLVNIKKMFINTKGIIVDMRCYPSDFMPFTFVPFIKHGSSDFVEFTVGSLSNPGQFVATNKINSIGENVYNGKVVVIVNEQTQSQAEFTTMAFQSSPNVTVIGSTTAGADGNISQIILPGGIVTFISGIGVIYPDGTQTQRKGVKIDYYIKPTIAGIKNGQDELIEKAKYIINHRIKSR